MFTKQEFIQKIRGKFPQYNDMSDDALYDSVTSKYPEYKSQIKEQKEDFSLKKSLFSTDNPVVSAVSGVGEGARKFGADVNKIKSGYFDNQVKGLPAPTGTNLGFVGKTVSSAIQRESNFTKRKTQQGDIGQTGIEKGLDVAGQTAGLFGDIIGQGVVSGLTTPMNETQKQTFKNVAQDVAQSSFGQKVGKEAKNIQEGFLEFERQNPRVGSQLRNVGNIGMLAGDVAGAAALKKGAVGVTGAMENPKIIDMGKGVVSNTGEIIKKGGENIAKVPSNINKGIVGTTDFLDTGVEKVATKILGSSDGTKELFKATSPSYNTLSKNKDITKIVDSAKKADETIVKYGYKPKNTSERRFAYEGSMKKVWGDIEKTRDGISTKVDAGNIAKIIDDEVSKFSVGGFINPAIQRDVDALLKQADYFRGIGEIDIPTLGNQRTLINEITNWGQTTEFGDTFSTVMKKVGTQIRSIEDSIISQAGKGTTGNKLREYGALRNMYDDIVKQDVKALRAKGMAIDESFGRIAGISETIGGVAQLLTNPKQALPTMLSGGSKILLGKTAGKLKDPDFLIKTGYDKLYKKIKGEQVLKPKTIKKPLALPQAGQSSYKKPAIITPLGDRNIISQSKKGLEKTKFGTNKTISENAINYNLAKEMIKDSDSLKDLEGLKEEIIKLNHPRGRELLLEIEEKIKGIKEIESIENISETLKKQYGNDLINKFKKVFADENRNTTTKGGGKYTDIENMGTPNGKALSLSIQEYLSKNQWIDDTVQEVYERLKDNVTKQANKPKIISKPLNNKAGFINPTAIISDIKKGIEKAGKLNINEVANKLATGFKTNIQTIKNHIKDYIRKNGPVVKEKLADLFDYLADKLGVRSKFIEDSRVIKGERLNPYGSNPYKSGDFKKLSDLDSDDLYRAIGTKDWENIPKEVTLYRGIRENKDFDLFDGDFLTKNKKIAQNFAGKTGKVKAFKVKTEDLQGSDFGYEEVIYKPTNKPKIIKKDGGVAMSVSDDLVSEAKNINSLKNLRHRTHSFDVEKIYRSENINDYFTDIEKQANDIEKLGFKKEAKKIRDIKYDIENKGGIEDIDDYDTSIDEYNKWKEEINNITEAILDKYGEKPTGYMRENRNPFSSK